MQGGTGLRNLVDRYVFLEHFNGCLNMDHIETELSLMGIKDYEIESRQMIQKLFSGNKLSDSEKELLDYYIFSGSYGRTETLVDNKVKALGGGLTARIQYASTRFLIPFSQKNPHYKAFKAQYPLFYQHKILLLFLPFYRLFRGLKHSKGRIITEIKH